MDAACAVALRVGHYDWTDSEKSSMNATIKAEKKLVIEIIREKTGEIVDVADPIGHGGTSTTGSVIKRLFGPNVSVLIDLVPENHRINFQNCVLSLNCLLAAYSSSR